MLLYDTLSFLEKKLAKAQGKGYGSSSISAEIKSVVKLLGQSQPTLCVDIGGNIGDYSAALVKQFASARVVCFEPSKTNIDILNNRFHQNERITVEPVGVSVEAGTLTLYSDKPGSGLGSLTKRNLENSGKAFEVEETVTIIRFEDYWREQLNSAAIDFMKLDVEGHEMDALLGCGDSINHTQLIQFEFGGSNIDTRTYFQDFWAFFLDHGFKLYRITPFGIASIKRYKEIDECFRTTNFLAQKA